ncbi:hypothetical protein DL89DRAFT_294031 [Linderina pennispora]|uniref:DC-UbP/UBTD2 N-terminal domain-containing protein n=1 Tax=Linderina pennispora TaxID=61395 RepID=A0A1Y1W5N0_9FUNG|nr:uncharacterized protein DL89DRAFT_294031 [Linderina pennispora]ORX68849.1 hypothetical protein DL89DRAFT_294031 [Linderina pennispora]
MRISFISFSAVVLTTLLSSGALAQEPDDLQVAPTGLDATDMASADFSLDADISSSEEFPDDIAIDNGGIDEVDDNQEDVIDDNNVDNNDTETPADDAVENGGDVDQGDFNGGVDNGNNSGGGFGNTGGIDLGGINLGGINIGGGGNSDNDFGNGNNGSNSNNNGGNANDNGNALRIHFNRYGSPPTYILWCDSPWQQHNSTQPYTLYQPYPLGACYEDSNYNAHAAPALINARIMTGKSQMENSRVIFYLGYGASKHTANVIAIIEVPDIPLVMREGEAVTVSNGNMVERQELDAFGWGATGVKNMQGLQSLTQPRGRRRHTVDFGRSPWTSETAMTESELQQQREAFWDTAPAYEGRREVWQALQLACETEDAEMAAVVLESAGVTVPTGRVLDGVYDELGARYVVPRYCLSRPQNIVSADSTGAGVCMAKESDLVSVSSAGEASLVAHVTEVTVRLAIGRDVVVKLAQDTTLAAVERVLKEEHHVPTHTRVRFFYLGRVLDPASVPLRDLKLGSSGVIQAMYS